MAAKKSKSTKQRVAKTISSEVELEPQVSPRVAVLRQILTHRVRREPVPGELRDQDDIRFTSSRRVHSVLAAMREVGAGLDEVEQFVEREIG